MTRLLALLVFLGGCQDQRAVVKEPVRSEREAVLEGEEQTSPAIAPPSSDGPPKEVKPQALWDEDPEGITSYMFEGQFRTLSMSKKEGEFSGGWKISKGKAPPVKLGEKRDEYLKFWAAPVPLRSLSKPSKETLAEAHFQHSRRVEISWGSKTRTLLLGDKVKGSKDRYLLDPATEQVYVFSKESIDLFDLRNAPSSW